MSGSPTDDETAAAVSEAVSRLFLEKFGKGPLHIDTYVNGDVMTTLMSDVLNAGERVMIADGRQVSVLTTRMLWQRATEAMFKEAVGAATGREVLAVISGLELNKEMGSEVFVLAPR